MLLSTLIHVLPGQKHILYVFGVHTLKIIAFGENLTVNYFSPQATELDYPKAATKCSPFLFTLRVT